MTSGIARAKRLTSTRIQEQLREWMPHLAPSLMQFGQYWPHDHTADGYSRPIAPDNSESSPSSEFPVPPKEFWANYCNSAASYLGSGQEDVATMTRLLGESGAPIEAAGRILELGCAGGRMIRWLTHLAPEIQLWGTDVWSSAVLWCQDHLAPPCYFATNTIAPHLPFEDRSFGLIYCGSVFTHIDDLAEAWFLELHRILRPGGRLCFSVNDLHAVRVFDGKADPDDYSRYYERTEGRANWDAFVRMLDQRDDYQRFRRGEAYMFTMGRSLNAHVMWSTDVLCRRLEHGFRKCSVTPEAYGHQTLVVLERI